MQLQASGQACFRPVIPYRDVCTHGEQRARDRQPVAAEADHSETTAGEQHGRKCAHRIFKVARPTSARIIEMIQKRITIVGSDQPFFS